MMEPQLVHDPTALEERGDRSLFLMGRLKPGATLEQARARFNVLASQMHEAYPEQWTNVSRAARSVSVLPESEARVFPALRGAVLGVTGMLMAVVGLVLLIACANVANLLLARATARRKEIAVRLALGAGRGRLIRQLLTESVLLSLLSGALGFLLALWLTDLIAALKPPVAAPIALDLSLDARVLVFTLGISLLTGLLFGLAPALQASKPDLVTALKDEGGSLAASYRRSRLRGSFVVIQVALSLVLLICASLFLRSLRHANAIDPGFDPRNVLTMSFDLGSQGYKKEQGQLFYQQLLERAQSTLGVQSASLASEVPLGLGGSRRGIAIEGHERQPGEDMEFHYTVAGPNYFRAMGIPLVRGRDFSPEDRAGAPGVAIVNETMGRRFWPGQDPLGKRVSVNGSEGPYLEIVGVVKDGKYVTLGEEPLPFFSIPFLQNYESSMTLLVRGTGDPKALIPILRGEVQALDKSVPVTGVKTMTEQVSLSLLPARIASTLLSIFGLLALLLAAVGIYGVISYAVSQRTREIGIRMALGARTSDVLKLVVGQGLMLALIGVSVGLVTAFALTRFLASLLYGISATDLLTFTVVPVLWLVVALIASYVPARRATKVDPMVALRYE
ncbi:MAG: ABC transporter permease [Acidobacteria bacterium]|nr:ABC transporter permease [Acidobacteriota bacterium]